MTEYYAAYLQQQMISEVAYIAFLVALTVVTVAALWSIASYVLESVGIYTIARRRGQKHPWMAWVPVLNNWLLGSLSDQYQYVVKGQVRSRRVLLLVLGLASLIIGWVGGVVSVDNISGAVEILGGSQPVYAGTLSTTVGIAALAGFAGLATKVALTVLRYMALYDVYTSCDTHNNVMYLVLGILFSFLNPIFLFVNRNKEEGMPPRREQPRYQPPVEEYAEV